MPLSATHEPPVRSRTWICARGAARLTTAAARCSTAGRRRRGAQDLGDDLERQDPGHAPAGVEDRRELARGRDEVGQRVAQDVVEVDHRLDPGRQRRVDAVAAQGALGQPAERAALAVDEQRGGEVGLGDPLADPRHRVGLADHRRLPQVDVRDPLEREALERAVVARRSPRRTRRRAA
jgi:hypothetical protein